MISSNYRHRIITFGDKHKAKSIDFYIFINLDFYIELRALLYTGTQGILDIRIH
jgi:hypothetical protein